MRIAPSPARKASADAEDEHLDLMGAAPLPGTMYGAASDRESKASTMVDLEAGGGGRGGGGRGYADKISVSRPGSLLTTNVDSRGEDGLAGDDPAASRSAGSNAEKRHRSKFGGLGGIRRRRGKGGTDGTQSSSSLSPGSSPPESPRVLSSNGSQASMTSKVSRTSATSSRASSRKKNAKMMAQFMADSDSESNEESDGDSSSSEDDLLGLGAPQVFPLGDMKRLQTPSNATQTCRIIAFVIVTAVACLGGFLYSMAMSSTYIFKLDDDWLSGPISLDLTECQLSFHVQEPKMRKNSWLDGFRLIGTASLRRSGDYVAEIHPRKLADVVRGQDMGPAVSTHRTDDFDIFLVLDGRLNKHHFGAENSSGPTLNFGESGHFELFAEGGITDLDVRIYGLRARSVDIGGDNPCHNPSLIIAIVVSMTISITLGLAAAFVLTRIHYSQSSNFLESLLKLQKLDRIKETKSSKSFRNDIGLSKETASFRKEHEDKKLRHLSLEFFHWVEIGLFMGRVGTIRSLTSFISEQFDLDNKPERWYQKLAATLTCRAARSKQVRPEDQGAVDLVEFTQDYEQYCTMLGWASMLWYHIGITQGSLASS
eukprot:g834.t1